MLGVSDSLAVGQGKLGWTLALVERTHGRSLDSRKWGWSVTASYWEDLWLRNEKL